MTGRNVHGEAAPAASHCDRCGGNGIIGTGEPYEFDFCSCPTGRDRAAEDCAQAEYYVAEEERRDRLAFMEPFAAYFNVADELWGGLRLDELDPDWVARARKGAREHGLAWPPHLPDAEEYALDHPEVRRS